jgi:hypothetical protein
MKSLSLVLLAFVAFCASAFASPTAHRASVRALPLVGWLDVRGCDNFAAAIPQRLETTWTSGGLQQRVITDRHDNEPTDTWAKRHKEAVKTAVSYFPPDAPQHQDSLYAGTWKDGEVLYTAWDWQDHEDGLVLPTVMSTTRDIANGESVPAWRLRHITSARICELEMSPV